MTLQELMDLYVREVGGFSPEEAPEAALVGAELKAAMDAPHLLGAVRALSDWGDPIRWALRAKGEDAEIHDADRVMDVLALAAPLRGQSLGLLIRLLSLQAQEQ